MRFLLVLITLGVVLSTFNSFIGTNNNAVISGFIKQDPSYKKPTVNNVRSTFKVLGLEDKPKIKKDSDSLNKTYKEEFFQVTPSLFATEGVVISPAKVSDEEFVSIMRAQIDLMQVENIAETIYRAERNMDFGSESYAGLDNPKNHLSEDETKVMLENNILIKEEFLFDRDLEKQAIILPELFSQ